MTTQCSCKHYCIVLLGILALSSVIGVIAWAISAEVVMGARRQARKNDALLRFHAPFESSEDFSINDADVRIEDSNKIVDINPEIYHNEDLHKISADKLIPQSRIYNADEKERKNPYLYDDNEEEELMEEYEDTIDSNSRHVKPLSTTKPTFISFDLEKIRKTISGTHVADVIDKLVAQRKVLNPKTANSPQIVVVAPVGDSLKKSKSQSTTTSTTTLRPLRSISNSNLSTIRGMTFVKPTKSTTTESSIRSLLSGITTVRPKRTKTKVQTAKPKKSTVTTTSTTKAMPTTTRPRTRKTVTNKFKPTTSTAKPTTMRSVTSTAKPRLRGLEYLLEKVEKLEKQHKLFSSKSAEHDLFAESSSRESIYKPKNQYMPYRQSDSNHDKSEYSYSNADQHHSDFFQQRNPASYQESNRHFNGRQWSPLRSHSDIMPLHITTMHDPPPLPPPQPQPHSQPPPPQHMSQALPSFHTSLNPMFASSNNIPQHQLHGTQLYAPHQHNQALNSISFNQEMPVLQNSHLMPAPILPEQQNEGLIKNPKLIKKGFKFGNVFKKFLPIPGFDRQTNTVRKEQNNRAISLSMGGDNPIAQESRPSYQYAPNEGTEDKGVALHFGGGPLGGGGQIMTSPLGIVKTLLLPLMPKPRVNLNGKVVFGVVLENGVGFGKKPKVLAQHYSEGHL